MEGTCKHTHTRTHTNTHTHTGRNSEVNTGFSPLSNPLPPLPQSRALSLFAQTNNTTLDNPPSHPAPSVDVAPPHTDYETDCIGLILDANEEAPPSHPPPPICSRDVWSAGFLRPQVPRYGTGPRPDRPCRGFC